MKSAFKNTSVKNIASKKMYTDKKKSVYYAIVLLSRYGWFCNDTVFTRAKKLCDFQCKFAIVTMVM